jgi:hypothetical protein
MMNPTSRYARVPILIRQDEAGRDVAYLGRRFAPQPPSTSLGVITVAEKDRIDRLTARAIGDPTQYWRVADANAALDAVTLTDEPGRRLIAPQPGIVEDPV